MIDGSKPRPGDMGGTPSHLWWSFEREETPRFANEAARFAHTHDTDTAPEIEKGESSLESHKSHDSPKQIIPCYPVESQVTYEGKVWTVQEINLATGMHVIHRPPGVTKTDLRMLDLTAFIADDEEI